MLAGEPFFDCRMSAAQLELLDQFGIDPGLGLRASVSRLLLARAHSGLDGADDSRSHRHGDNAQHDDLEVILHERNTAEEVSHQNEQADPGYAADAVEQRELAKFICRYPQ